MVILDSENDISVDRIFQFHISHLDLVADLDFLRRSASS